MLRSRTGWDHPSAITGLGAIVVALFCASLAEAHDISPGAPDWCKEEKEEKEEVKEEKEEVEANGDRSATQGKQPGTWPGPRKSDNVHPTELGAINLGTEFPGFAGRNLRARYWRMDPGAVIGHHCHDDRPAMVYLLTGRVKETKWVDGKVKVNEYAAGDAIPEGSGTRHWWVNPGKEVVTLVAIDLVNIDHTPPLARGAGGGAPKDLAWLNLATEFPHIGSIWGIEARGSILLLAEGEATGVTNHRDRPRFAYVVEGQVTEHRSEGVEPTIQTVHKKGGSSLASGAMSSYWVNDDKSPATIYVYEFVHCQEDCRPTGRAPR